MKLSQASAQSPGADGGLPSSQACASTEAIEQNRVAPSTATVLHMIYHNDLPASTSAPSRLSLALFILFITPGPERGPVSHQDHHSGKSFGIAAGLHTLTGCYVHTLLAAFGLSALLAASATAFTVLKMLSRSISSGSPSRRSDTAQSSS